MEDGLIQRPTGAASVRRLTIGAGEESSRLRRADNFDGCCYESENASDGIRLLWSDFADRPLEVDLTDKKEVIRYRTLSGAADEGDAEGEAHDGEIALRSRQSAGDGEIEIVEVQAWDASDYTEELFEFAARKV